MQPVLQSPVTWVNVLTAIVAVVLDFLPAMQERLSVDVYFWLTVALAIFNAVARVFYVNKPITEVAAARP